MRAERGIRQSVPQLRAPAISLHDMILRMEEAGLELNYGVAELEKDLQA